MHSLKTTAWLLTSIPLALSHGGGMLYTIDGVEHVGAYYKVFNATTGSIQRDWTWDGVNTVDSEHLACRWSGNPTTNSYHAPMKAGSTININYTDPAPQYDPWAFGHGYGPMLAYMAACPSTGCETLNLTSPIWFKVWQSGLLSGTWVDGHWGMADVMNFATLDIPTPKNLKKGKYMLKHDMISIETGQMQIFPNCIQLDVSGEGTSAPTEKELVAFPGEYNGFDEISWEGPHHGSEWFWTTHGNDTTYPMPGSPVWQG